MPRNVFHIFSKKTESSFLINSIPLIKVTKLLELSKQIKEQLKKGEQGVEIIPAEVKINEE